MEKTGPDYVSPGAIDSGAGTNYKDQGLTSNGPTQGNPAQSGSPTRSADPSEAYNTPNLGS